MTHYHYIHSDVSAASILESHTSQNQTNNSQRAASFDFDIQQVILVHNVI